MDKADTLWLTTPQPADALGVCRDRIREHLPRFGLLRGNGPPGCNTLLSNAAHCYYPACSKRYPTFCHRARAAVPAGIPLGSAGGPVRRQQRPR
jgi:hypothetical protein